MRICILSAFEDSMLRDTGGSVRIYNLAKGLASLGSEVELVMPRFTETNELIDGVNVHYFKGFLPKWFLRLVSKFIGVDRPTSLFFYDFVFIQKASKIIRESDVVQFEQQSAGALLIPVVAKIFRKPVIIDCHDTFQALRVKKSSLIRKIFETSAERMIYSFASAILTVSEKEKELLASLGIGKNNMEVIPNGVDTKAFTRSLDTTKIRESYGLANHHVVVFVGNLEYSPNREAIKLLSSEIAPKVSAVLSNVKFLVVGKLRYKPELPGLVFTGFVDNVSDILNASDVAVAPLFQGSGTRLKILEYFSCSLPVVSTSIGAEGLEVENGVNIFIENDVGNFAIRIIELLRNKQLSIAVGEAARLLVTSAYDWGFITKELDNRLRDLVGEHHADRSTASSAEIR